LGSGSAVRRFEKKGFYCTPKNQVQVKSEVIALGTCIWPKRTVNTQVAELRAQAVEVTDTTKLARNMNMNMIKHAYLHLSAPP
jgi:hypothetical protein